MDLWKGILVVATSTWLSGWPSSSLLCLPLMGVVLAMSKPEARPTGISILGGPQDLGHNTGASKTLQAAPIQGKPLQCDSPATPDGSAVPAGSLLGTSRAQQPHLLRAFSSREPSMLWQTLGNLV